MMNSVNKTACALAMLTTTTTAVMAEHLNLKVIGTITPTSCVPKLSGGGTIDYGQIIPSSLKKDAYNRLEEKQLNFSITCDAPAKVALKVVDGRMGSLAGDTDGGNTMERPQGIGRWAVGLGMHGDKKIGGYSMFLKDVSLDGAQARSLYRPLSSSNWGTDEGELRASARIHSWGVGGEHIAPTAFTSLSGTLSIQAYINKASEFDLTKPVKLDGLSTLELVYL